MRTDRRTALVFGWFVLVLLVAPAVAKERNDSDARFLKGWHRTAYGGVMPYRLFVPEPIEPDRLYPLVLYLHGSSGNGSDNHRHIEGGNALGSHIWTEPENQAKYPCFVLAPQTNRGWRDESIEFAFQIVERVMKEYPIDPDRLYVVGQSMGGLGAWGMLIRYPDRFAAGVIVAGGGGLEKRVAAIAKIPLWIFHGRLDQPERARNMVAALRRAGGNPRYTEYAGEGHVIWERAYREPELLPWLFSQRRPASESESKR